MSQNYYQPVREMHFRLFYYNLLENVPNDSRKITIPPEIYFQLLFYCIHSNTTQVILTHIFFVLDLTIFHIYTLDHAPKHMISLRKIRRLLKRNPLVLQSLPEVLRGHDVLPVFALVLGHLAGAAHFAVLQRVVGDV